MVSSADEHPDNVDVQVGQRVREFRTAKGLSLDELAAGIGVTYQQVQKYERGINRISASRLLLISKILEVSVGDFFPLAKDDDPTLREADASCVLIAKRILSLDPEIRVKLLSLVDAIGPKDL